MLIAAGILCGCNPDKSDDTQVVTPNGGVPRDAPAANANVPDAVKGSIPGK
jgi:hypothetical protein